MSDTLTAIQAALREHSDPSKPDFLSNWFKNRPGYPPDDNFLGTPVPAQRKIVSTHYRRISLHDIEKLLSSIWHEERLTGLLLLMKKYEKFSFNRQDIFDMYIDNLLYINNWDLVDTSAPYIVGEHLKSSPYKMKVLRKMAGASGVWERRVAMIATLQYLKSGSTVETLEIAELLLGDKDDYIHKAVGWMLREMGKRVDEELLIDFLNKHADTMPRTMLRYAIEKLPAETRLRYLNKGKHVKKYA